MKWMTGIAALMLSLTMAGGALAQSAETPPARGAGAVPEEDKNQVEMRANAAGSAVAIGAGEVAPGQTASTTPHRQHLADMDLNPDHMENGRWYNAEGIPVPKIEEDGTVDWATFSGFRRYNSECHQCHGPDGEGSSYAPALKNSVLVMDYWDYQQVVASGRTVVNAAANQVMPAFGTNKNAWCYVDDIYVYLVAHGSGMIPRGRPAKRADKPDEYTAFETTCMES
ncbi:MAG: c-type cytochrome, methanol metabolism-related [Paracoccus sp. (in: a-proteobacteria)]|uniref:c-type cytochrome, methanol metabolism-related n=1 Tax=Paracoccus sp. TaxID=267 RepID=UPI0026DF6C58|nr:c-type cytochrome, methanol metabolism-related [Paracoccus sp. (in: a-proteobacteria)]MDO5631888.1 c-type cytochrome, methanol metabolism-related [Paracoccus sp. (in: a-proteobacteria)]